jgi:hypothetical protein
LRLFAGGLGRSNPTLVNSLGLTEILSG